MLTVEPLGMLLPLTKEALRTKQSFALFALPGEEAYNFVALQHGDGEFEIIPYLGKSCLPLSLQKIELPTRRSSTPKNFYLRAVSEIIRNCRLQGGKTVYSRVEFIGDANVGPVEAAAKLFARFPHTFRFLYHTPETGGWFGATPETLIDYSVKSRRFQTMALAGTRPMAEVSQPWDEKNQRENLFVSDYIVATLKEMGIEAEVSEPFSVNYGAIEHICRKISGCFPPEMLNTVIDALNPTPALCGVPKQRAIDLIGELEMQPRGCYGGALKVRIADGWRVFVNLRCAYFLPEKNDYWLYGGGGITAASNPETEWQETASKMLTLKEILTQ